MVSAVAWVGEETQELQGREKGRRGFGTDTHCA